MVREQSSPNDASRTSNAISSCTKPPMSRQPTTVIVDLYRFTAEFYHRHKKNAHDVVGHAANIHK